ncbi:MAG: LysR family transcriptional regulator, partial [Phyllobacteriaceae bacterium]|nr:LysR family transcriptional regulator [Phyllobacteriaceae bacterium]
MSDIDMIDFDGIDLDLLVALDVLLDEANVTRAAARLGLGQPAVSARLVRLRRFFADPLLVPSENGRGMIATPRAAALRAPLKRALLGLAEAVRPPEAFDPARRDRRFVIAAGDNAVVSLGPALAEAVAAAAPNLRLTFVQPRAGGLAGDLERGEVDLSIVSERVVPPGARVVTLRREDFVAIRRKDRPRDEAPFDLDAYCTLDHVLVSPSGALHGYVDEVLERLGRRR